MQIACSYCPKTLSFAKGELFNQIVKADWRVFGVDISTNSHYYICDACRKAKKLNLPLYTPPALTKKMQTKPALKLPGKKLSKSEEPIYLKI